MQRLLNALFSRFKKKQPEVQVIEYLTETVYDEESQIQFTINFVCACERRVVRLTEEANFYCLHCDRICYAGESCKSCRMLFLEEEEEEEDE